jgi:hypothetical protein
MADVYRGVSNSIQRKQRTSLDRNVLRTVRRFQQ